MWYLVLSRPVVAREQMMGSLDDHLARMRSQHEASNVLFSGPTGDHSMGIYVIRASSREEAQTVADSDPFHSLGFRNYEMLDWEVHQVMGAGPFSSGEKAFGVRWPAGRVRRSIGRAGSVDLIRSLRRVRLRPMLVWDRMDPGVGSVELRAGC